MAIAFYAPLKAPDHPVASGDRSVARAFFALLEQLGCEPYLASRLRSFDCTGDVLRQQRLAGLAARERSRLARRIRRGTLPCPRLWFTYHAYHKSPDHLGPALSHDLRIPYVLAESSLGTRQADGPWAIGHAATETAVARADLVLALARRDLAGLAGAVGSADRLAHLPPFIDTGPFRHARESVASLPTPPTGSCRLLTVAMMRDDVKRQSYALLRDALLRLDRLGWRLTIVGDGPARAAIEADFAIFGERVSFLGALPPERLPAVYAAAQLFCWPAIREAYGLVLLEAQAAGLPVVAGLEGGVPEIVLDGQTGLLVAGRAAGSFAEALASLIDDPRRRAEMGEAAARHALDRHDRGPALDRLAAALERFAPCLDSGRTA